MIASALKKLFSPDPYQLPAHEAYVALVSASRQPFFYAQAGVADTIDGRFDVIALHVFLLTQRLKHTAPEFARALWEAFFSDMDRSLREMGASDTGIGKRIKKMVQAFYGRMEHYEKTFGDEEAFKEALIRNLYRGADVSAEQIAQVVGYMQRNAAHVAAQDEALLVQGKVSFTA